MLLDQLRQQHDQIHAAYRHDGARRIRVFSSVTCGEERPDSDIDFFVDLSRGYNLFKQRMPLAERLAQITERRLDVIPEYGLNRHNPCGRTARSRLVCTAMSKHWHACIHLMLAASRKNP